MVDSDYFDIVAGVLQGDTLAAYLFIICLEYVLTTSIDKIKENGFKLTKERSRRYPHKQLRTLTTPMTWRFWQIHPPKPKPYYIREVSGIGLHVNVDKTEYMCFNEKGDISTLNSSSLKLVDKFTYLGSSVSSIMTDINMRLAKAWTAIDRLSVIWKSDLTDKIKRSFFSKHRSCRYCYMDAPHGC